VRYLCTIYTHAYTYGGTSGFTGTEPSFDSPTAEVMVTGGSMRQAAAKAYVRCVGRRRARLLEGDGQGLPNSAAQERDPRAIAASLRRTCRRIGEVFELDHAFEAWLIKVEPVPATPAAMPKQPTRLRYPVHRLLHLCRTPSPN
jgi:hypothetical protein